MGWILGITAAVGILLAGIAGLACVAVYRVSECQDYYEALNIIDQYVTITGKEEPEMGGMEME